MYRVPFTLADDGLREFEGFAYFEDEFIVLEIDSKLLGLLDTDRDVVKIEPAALVDVRLDQGLIRDKLCLRPKTLELLKAVPGKHASEVKLPVWRKYRDEALSFVSEARRRMYDTD